MKCSNCPTGTQFGHKLCSTCLEKSRVYSASHYEKKKSDRLCRLCSEPVESAKGINCDRCRADLRKKCELRKANGKCVTCGKSDACNGQKCKTCYDAYVANVESRKRRRLEAGLCSFCDQPRIGTSLCESHYFKFTAKVHLKTSKRHDDLRQLFVKQNGICPYSGIKLKLGVDASIDHRVPKSRGGSEELDNLQWTHINVNLMKQSMTEDEFLAMVRTVFNHTLTAAVAE